MMSDLVMVSKKDLIKLREFLFSNVLDKKAQLKSCGEFTQNIINKATPVSGEAVGKIVYDRKIDEHGNVYHKSRPQLIETVSEEKLLSYEQDTKLYTTPQPADTVPVDRFNKLVDALISQVGTYISAGWLGEIDDILYSILDDENYAKVSREINRAKKEGLQALAEAMNGE